MFVRNWEKPVIIMSGVLCWLNIIVMTSCCIALVIYPMVFMFLDCIYTERVHAAGSATGLTDRSKLVWRLDVCSRRWTAANKNRKKKEGNVKVSRRKFKLELSFQIVLELFVHCFGFHIEKRVAHNKVIFGEDMIQDNDSLYYGVSWRPQVMYAFLTLKEEGKLFILKIPG